jgi:hypothetical protein
MSSLEQIEYLNLLKEEDGIYTHANIDSDIKNIKLTTTEFFNVIESGDKSVFIRICEYLFKVYGTKNACNRFDIGNCIEFAVADLLRQNGLHCDSEPNKNRIDIDIWNYKCLSIKYSKNNNIKLHNSLGFNNNRLMVETLIIRPNCIYLVSPELVSRYGIDIQKYMKNTGDGLELKNSLLTCLHKHNYKYMTNIKINTFDNECENRMCSELVYKHVKNKLKIE